MAYSDASNAAFRLTTVTHGGTELAGALGCTIRKIVDRAILKADKDSTPISRPINLIDAIADITFLDQSGPIAHGASVGNIVATFSTGAGGSGSITIGGMVAGSVTHNLGEGPGKNVSQEFLFQGSSLTYTPTV